MTREEQAHVNRAYAHISSAMDELTRVMNKDKGLILVQGQLYKLEDMLYQYATERRDKDV